MKVGIFVSHPVQYHVCLWRGLSAFEDLDVEVFFFSDQGVAEKVDPGFGEKVEWDVPLLEGYESTFLRRDAIDRVTDSSIPNVDQFLAEERFDVVFLHGYTQRFARQLIARKKRHGYKIVLRGEFSDMLRPGRTWWKDCLKNLYLKWFYAGTDHFCPIGQDAISHLHKRGIDNKKMTLAPYSVDDEFIDRQRTEWDRTEARKNLGIGDDQVVFIFSGKLVARKQPGLLADAAERLASDPRFVVCYLGSGDLMREIEKRLRPVLGERLLMPGFVNQSQLGLYFASADVFVLPSAYDTWGLVVNEAMHWGLPCIVSNRTGSRRDLIAEGETGFVHDWDSADQLTDCMQRFLEDPSLSMVMGRKAAQKVEGFRSGVTVEGIANALRKVAST